MVDRITPTIQEFGNLVKQSYLGVNERFREFTINGVSHNYVKEKSTDLWCWYENNDVILIGIHGADDIRLNILAIQQFINPEKIEPEIEMFCDTHKELSESDKGVFIAAHSLGTWILSSCELINDNDNISAILFGPYAPVKEGRKIDIMASNPRFKKIFYDNDWFAKNLLKNDKLQNTLILTPRTIPQTFLNGHSLVNFTDNNIELLNMDIKKFIPRTKELEQKKEIGKEITLSIMSYNLKLFEDIVQDTRSNFRAKLMVDWFRKNIADVEILVVQEMFSESATRIMQKGLGKLGFRSSKKVGGFDLLKIKLEDGGVMVFSKLPFTDEKQTVFKRGDKEDKIASKGGVRITIEKEGIPINIIGTHLQSGRKPIHFNIKNSQIKQLNALGTDDLTFIIGDFNFDYIKFRDNFEEFLDNNDLETLTIPEGESSTTDMQGNPTGNWLDYILYQKTDNYEVNGDIKIVKPQAPEPYRMDKKLESSLLKEAGKVVEKVEEIRTEITGIFKTKKQRKKARRRRKRKAEAKRFSAIDLSDHFAIKSLVRIRKNK